MICFQCKVFASVLILNQKVEVEWKKTCNKSVPKSHEKLLILLFCHLPPQERHGEKNDELFSALLSLLRAQQVSVSAESSFWKGAMQCTGLSVVVVVLLCIYVRSCAAMTVTRSAAAADSPCYSVRPFVLRGSRAGGRPCWTWLPSRCGFRSTCTIL